MTFLSTTTVDHPSGTQAHSQRSRSKPARGKTKRLSLALQGGVRLARSPGACSPLGDEPHEAIDRLPRGVEEDGGDEGEASFGRSRGDVTDPRERYPDRRGPAPGRYDDEETR